MSFFRKKGDLPLAESHLTDPQDPLEEATRQDEIERLRTLILSLDPADQELIRLRFVVDLPFGEMAVLLKKKEEAVKKSLYRMLARLQSQLEENHE